MRLFLLALSAVGALALVQTPAQAADGCSWGPGGQLYCQPGARPGVPLYGYGGYGYGGGYHGHYQPRHRYYHERRHHRRPKVRIYF
jgi:hypothetical protein